MTSSALKVEFPSQGWKQLLVARQKILDAYDQAREQARSHKVETYHGNVLEAQTREWLTAFMPRRFGVTPGYVISPGLPSSAKAPHFDIIVYDQLESPVLWTENCLDSSEQGWSRAIPVEYTLAVLEVKSSFSSRNVVNGVEHLRDLAPLMSGIDHTDERYKLHLPPNFYCGIVFAELRKDAEHSMAALEAMRSGHCLRGFLGGLILRAQSHSGPAMTGRVCLTQGKEALAGMQEVSLAKSGLSASIEVSENVHIGSLLMWSEIAFSQFALDLVAIAQGRYDQGRVSSFYGLGSSESEVAVSSK